ncbi:hypothetical protein CEP54_016171 [Fusarium duplospermum]|uniref:Zinc transporter n=1 Tax=Fusarium duplospermum TaxID=1325734 RepID=A0A428NHC6_9HYPO|nr:hypothetical protein CEP54_016171 [Fusarium duplospermum]
MEYEATTAAIVMAGLFLAFLIEFIFSRILRGQMAKQAEVSYATISQTTLAKVESTNVTIMEAGIIFHSLLIGVTTVVAGDSYYVTLAVVILFHQLFEGIALGSRIAALGYGAAFSKSSTVDAMQPHVHQTLGAEAEIDLSQPSTVSLMKKLITATAFSFVTPVGMAIGIGVLSSFNGNDPSTIVAIGTLDALSAGILVWVGVAEMMAYDWMLDDDMANASWFTTSVAMFGLIAGMALMSFLGKWA